MIALEEVVLLDVSPKVSIAQLHEQFLQLSNTTGDGQLDEFNFVRNLVEAGLETDAAQKVAQKMSRGGEIEFSRFVAAFFFHLPCSKIV